MSFIHDIRSHLTPVVAIPITTISADNTPAAIDLMGYAARSIGLYVGVGGITFSGTNKVEFKLSHGDTATASEHTAVTLNDVNGVAASELVSGALSSGIIKSLTALHATPTLYLFDYVGSKRYVSLLADFGGTHGTGTPIGVIMIQGDPAFTSNVAAADLKA